MPFPDLNALPLPELWARLVDNGALRALLELARDEDLASGDITSELSVPIGRRAVAELRTRQGGVIAGLPVVRRVVEAFRAEVEVTPLMSDGAMVGAGATLATLAGPLRDLLAIERTALNLLGHLSGIATVTRRHVDAVSGTGALICDTRKTAPGMRHLEKYAVRCGGGTMHRIGLFDAVLMKDNHLADLDPDGVALLATSVARGARGRVAFVEVEVDTLDQLAALLRLPSGTIDIILLDNMSPAVLAKAVQMRDAVGTRPLLEASGGISLTTVREVAQCGVDRIAVGALTHSVVALDIGLDVVVTDGRKSGS